MAIALRLDELQLSPARRRRRCLELELVVPMPIARPLAVRRQIKRLSRAAKLALLK
jgi:hypothetical protein